MLDARLRQLIDPALNRAATRLARAGITANQVTITGFVIGMLAIPLLAVEDYEAALLCILLNRLTDGLDGALARKTEPTDFGGFLDITLDFIFYSGVVFGFCLGNPAEAIYGAFLIFAFIGTGSSFLAYSALAAKRGITTEIRGLKSIYYLGGLTEGFETLLTLCLICLLPEYFAIIATVFGSMCWVTTATRIWVAANTLR